MMNENMMMNNNASITDWAMATYQKGMEGEPNEQGRFSFQPHPTSPYYVIAYDQREGSQHTISIRGIEDAIAFHKYSKIDMGNAMGRQSTFEQARNNTPWELWAGTFEKFDDDSVSISADGVLWAKIRWYLYTQMNWSVRYSYEEWRAGRAQAPKRLKDEVAEYVAAHAAGPLDNDMVGRLVRLGLSHWQKGAFDRLYLNDCNNMGMSAYIDVASGLIIINGGTKEQRQTATMALENALMASKSEYSTRYAILRMRQLQQTQMPPLPQI